MKRLPLVPFACATAALMVVAAGCITDEPAPVREVVPAFPEEEPEPAIEDSATVARARVRRELLDLLSRGLFLDAWNYQIPGGLSAFAEDAAKAERDEILATTLVERWADARIDKLGSGVASLVRQKDYEKARELVWRVGETPCQAVNAKVNEARVKLMRETINMAEWVEVSQTLPKEARALIAKGDYAAAQKLLLARPPLRTYTVLFDKQLDAVVASVVALGVPAEAPAPIVAKVRTLIAKAFADAAEAYEEAEPGKLPDLKPYMKEVERLQKLLDDHGCAKASSAQIAQELKAGLAPLIRQWCIPAPAKPSLKGLGTTRLDEKIEALRAELLAETFLAEIRAKAEALQADVDAKGEGLSSATQADVVAQDWAAARARIRDFPLIGHPQADAALYALRIGLLNASVNPNQCRAIIAAMRARCEGLKTVDELLAARAWLLEQKPVQDDYPKILDALQAANDAIIDLGVDAQETEAKIAEVRAEIQGLLDNRKGGLPGKKRDFDLTKLDEAIARLESAVAEQAPGAEAKRWGDVLREFAKAHETIPAPEAITTAEMNKRIEKARRELLAKIDLRLTLLAAETEATLAAEAYARVLAAMDREVSFDSQIAIAKGAIRQGLPTASDGFHAVLGDYCRAFRHLKAGKTLDAAQRVTLAVGAVRLNQPQVLTWAKGLGANLDAPAARDALARPPLLVAIQMGNAALVRALIQAGADPAKAKDAAGCTALHYAVRRGDVGLVRLALATFGANGKDAAGRTALFDAAESDQPALVALLLENGADVKAQDAAGRSPFDAACAADAADVLDVLAKAGAEASTLSLPLAAKNDALAAARWLVAHGADVNGVGVMEAAQKDSVTWEFLVLQGGVPVDQDGE